LGTTSSQEHEMISKMAEYSMASEFKTSLRHLSNNFRDYLTSSGLRFSLCKMKIIKIDS